MVTRFNYSENRNFSGCYITQIPKEKGKIVFQNKKRRTKERIRGKKHLVRTQIKRLQNKDNPVKDQELLATSNKVKSLPPVMFHTIPVALSMPISNKGDWMAFSAASLALVFPSI